MFIFPKKKKKPLPSSLKNIPTRFGGRSLFAEATITQSNTKCSHTNPLGPPEKGQLIRCPEGGEHGIRGHSEVHTGSGSHIRGAIPVTPTHVAAGETEKNRGL